MIRWITDDITFCTSDCDRRDCFRHPTNIQNPTIPHSFSTLKGTEHCPIFEAYADENGVGFRIKNGKDVDKN